LEQTDIWVLGGYQSDFARNLTREGADFATLIGEVVRETLSAARLDADQVGVVHVGNAFGHLRAIAELNFANLIGGGHPVGASGVRMLLDACRQVTGAAGDYQVEGADTFATLDIGGSTTTTVSFVVGAETPAA
jgi:acetyl-CoA acetyltransferase